MCIRDRKTFSNHYNLTPEQVPTTILGCWVINHNFKGYKNGDKIEVDGSCDVNIWYAYDNNTQTEIARAKTTYQGVIKVRDIVCDATTDHKDVIVRILQQPTCTNACINDGNIEVEVVFDALAEIIGETKMMVNVYNCNDTFDTIDNFENEINEDFINEN